FEFGSEVGVAPVNVEKQRFVGEVRVGEFGGIVTDVFENAGNWMVLCDVERPAVTEVTNHGRRPRLDIREPPENAVGGIDGIEFSTKFEFEYVGFDEFGRVGEIRL